MGMVLYGDMELMGNVSLFGYGKVQQMKELFTTIIALWVLSVSIIMLLVIRNYRRRNNGQSL